MRHQCTIHAHVCWLVKMIASIKKTAIFVSLSEKKDKTNIQSLNFHLRCPTAFNKNFDWEVVGARPLTRGPWSDPAPTLEPSLIWRRRSDNENKASSVLVSRWGNEQDGWLGGWLVSSGEVDGSDDGQRGKRDDGADRRPAAWLRQIAQTRPLHVRTHQPDKINF